jgi:hypothetical protein
MSLKSLEKNFLKSNKGIKSYLEKYAMVRKNTQKYALERKSTLLIKRTKAFAYSESASGKDDVALNDLINRCLLLL